MREIRIARGWTLAELAGRTGISRAGIQRIEQRGRTKAATALRIAKALEVPPYVLFPRLFTEAGCRWTEQSRTEPRLKSKPRRSRHD